MDLADRSVESRRRAEGRVPFERSFVITLGELIEAVSSVASDTAEVAAVVDHLRRQSRRSETRRALSQIDVDAARKLSPVKSASRP